MSKRMWIWSGSRPGSAKTSRLSTWVADQPSLLEAIDGIGDTGLVHLQSGSDHPHREGAPAAEGQQHEDLVPGEGDVEWSQHWLDAGQDQLVGTHQRRDGRHPVCGVLPAAPGPVPVRLGDGIGLQAIAVWHGSTDWQGSMAWHGSMVTQGCAIPCT